MGNTDCGGDSQRAPILQCNVRFCLRFDPYLSPPFLSPLPSLYRLSGNEHGASVVQHIHFSSQGEGTGPDEPPPGVLDGNEKVEVPTGGGETGGLGPQVRPLVGIDEAVLFLDVAQPIGSCRCVVMRPDVLSYRLYMVYTYYLWIRNDSQ